MAGLLNFFRGLTFRHVDYSTRHHSRSYDAGGTIATVALAASPFLICLAFGFWLGRITGG